MTTVLLFAVPVAAVAGLVLLALFMPRISEWAHRKDQFWS